MSSSFQETKADAGLSAPLGGWLKRVFDLVASVVALVAFGPFLLFLAVVVRMQDGGPSLYRHSRIGLNGQKFDCLKFRSMAVDSDRLLAEHLSQNIQALREWEASHKLKADPRITPIGSFLRKSSLDELPQLINIMTGHMSVVGPRPIVAAEVERYGAHFATYCAGRPGLTGVWQISGRSELSYADRVALDVRYAQRWSFAGDLVIILKTIPAVIRRRGSY